MEKYEPVVIEPYWQEKWEKNKLYQAVDFDKRPKKYILIEFPYPSGERLHVGHGRSYSALDAYSRKLRMQGFNVLYPIGWDAFGLPTENFAIKTGINPVKVTKQNIANAKKQAKAWGLSFDWSREVNTTDPKYYKWTQWIFLKMFEKGLAYQAEVPVNWCPSCKTNLADEEVLADGTHERCGQMTERRMQKQWLLKITQYAQRLLDDLKTVDYLPKIKIQQENWIGRSEGTSVQFPISNFSREAGSRSAGQFPIEVFTTRIDTLFGVTAMVLAPEHPLVEKLTTPEQRIQVKNYIEQAKRKSELERTDLSKEKTGVFTGSYCINPINNEKVPIWVGDYVIGWYGGGAVMVVPAHDQRDFDFAKKYGLEIREVVIGGDISKSAFEADGKLVSSGDFFGQSSAEARENITKWLKEHHLGGKTVVYKLRDWVFSRQHYWGEPIPVVYCATCAKTPGISNFPREAGSRSAGQFPISNLDGADYAIVPIPEDQLPVELPYLEKYQPSGTGESPLATVEEWVKTKCPVCGGPARRETDTMPNWAGSNWYYIAYLIADKLGNSIRQIGGRNSKDIFEYWLPVDLYNGGMEHTTLHLLYSRFIYKFLADIGVVPGVEPYARRHSHGVVLGPDGQKMSKSRGNVVNPDEVVREYGADTFRLYESFMGPFEQMIAWDQDGIFGCYRFLRRIWQQTFEKVKDEPTPKDLQRMLHQTIKKVTEDIDNLRFNTAIAAMMEFINQWTKGFLSKDDAKMFLQILAPFAPHITEELWQRLEIPRESKVPRVSQEYIARGTRGTRGTSPSRDTFESIHQSQWPKYDPKLAAEEKVTVVVQINGKVRDKLELDVQVARKQEEVEKLAKESPKIQSYLQEKKIKKIIFVSGKLINFVI